MHTQIERKVMKLLNLWLILIAMLCLVCHAQAESSDNEDDYWAQDPIQKFYEKKYFRVDTDLGTLAGKPAAGEASFEVTTKTNEITGLSESLTNLVYLSITPETGLLDKEFFGAIAKLSSLQCLDIYASNATSIGPQIALLTNLCKLECLTVYAHNATSVDAAVFEIEPLQELRLLVGNAAISSGITRLKHLRWLSIIVQGKRLMSMPADLSGSDMERLEVLGVTNVASLLPVLPRNLISLEISGCRLETVPKLWLDHQKLKYLGLSNNRLKSVPPGVDSMTSLWWVWLDLNLITNIPAFHLSDTSSLHISLIANPIQHIAPEDLSLVEAKRLLVSPMDQLQRPAEKP